MGRFQGKVAVVTGAGSGMGRECGLAFAREGAAVAFVDTDHESAEHAAGSATEAGARSAAYACDVSDALQVEETIRATVDELGSIDILVNNAGVLRTTTPLESIPEAEWDEVLAVNLKGVFLFSKGVLPIMKAAGGGKIVNISSSAGRSTSELGGAHYTVSKAGVLGLTRHMARECGAMGINVNSVCPGLVDTPMIHQHASPERLDYWRSQIPLGRFATTGEEADLVLFLASDQASYITGATIDFNGGSLLL